MLLLVNLQAWIQHHFPNICAYVEDTRYNETQPAATKYIPRKGLSSITAYWSVIDRKLGCDITWAHMQSTKLHGRYRMYVFTLVGLDVKT
jgi:hypothetical protein